VLFAVALIAAACECWSNSSLGTSLAIGLSAFVAWCVVAGCWLFRTIACGVTARRFFLRMLAVPLVFVASSLVIQVDAPLRIRFALARPAFEQAVSSIQAGAEPAQFAGRLGTYEVERVAHYDNKVYFTLDTFLSDAGIAYLPDGPPDPKELDQREGGGSVTPLAPPWYRFSFPWE
jgi:hypothetical protein